MSESTTESTKTELIPVEQVNAVELFTGGGLDPLLSMIEAQVADQPVDLTTAKGRGEVASLAYKVSRSKVVIDEAGKALVADWKKQAAEVDAGRKKAREFLDALRHRVREPLTKWEEEDAVRKAEEARLAAVVLAHDEAIALDVLWEREREIARKEAEMKRQQEEFDAMMRKAQIEQERKEREEQIAREAEVRAKREAAKALEAERDAREQAEKLRQAAEERGRQQAAAALKREQEARAAAEQAAKELAERAEEERVQAELRAKRDAELAVERERLRVANEAAEKERVRKLEEERLAKIEVERLADLNHRASVKADIADALMEQGFTEAVAEALILALDEGQVPHVRIIY